MNHSNDNSNNGNGGKGECFACAIYAFLDREFPDYDPLQVVDGLVATLASVIVQCATYPTAATQRAQTNLENLVRKQLST
jgi:hypothetical protein